MSRGRGPARLSTIAPYSFRGRRSAARSRCAAAVKALTYDVASSATSAQAGQPIT